MQEKDHEQLPRVVLGKPYTQEEWKRIRALIEGAAEAEEVLSQEELDELDRQAAERAAKERLARD
jgi:hypothetical protein